jgi:uncharacterized protein (TIGR02145 family)
MKENLKESFFRNGDQIPEAKSNEEWWDAEKNKKPVWCYYENDPSNGDIYGKLYNWYAVTDTRILAPIGWHIASYNEWSILRDFLGENSAGNKLKEIGATHWIMANKEAVLYTDFQALPGGQRYKKGFEGLGLIGQWWCTTKSERNLPWRWAIHHDHSRITWVEQFEYFGFSVRCIKD